VTIDPHLDQTFVREKQIMSSRITNKLRQRRDSREFERALRSASPAMQQELLAAAARHQNYNR
jgi:hypothetical protein